MFRIRFHGRGGQGMKTASRILGTAFFLAGYEVQDAPRYGAERRGAPIFAFVRADKKPVNERGVIDRPDLVIVADDTLVAMPAAGVLQGITDRTVLLINSHDSAATWQQRLNTPGRLLILPVVHAAEETVLERSELPYLGTTTAGAAARLVGVITLDQLQQAIRDELAHLGTTIVGKNLAHATAAYEQMAAQQGLVTEGREISARGYTRPEWIELPVDSANVAAPTIHAALTSTLANTGTWRTMRPVIDYERCNRCWWVCSEFCPDSAISVDAKGYPHIDLDHCKGCMICVAQCPPHAIAGVPEAEPQPYNVRENIVSGPSGGKT